MDRLRGQASILGQRMLPRRKRRHVLQMLAHLLARSSAIFVLDCLQNALVL